MSKIFKNMIPYWKSILVILMLLFVQAWCDLSLPSYTSDIIDVGIQNSGVEHVTPKRITEEEFQTAEFIMTDDEVDLWESLYTKKDGYYERNKASEKELDEADDTLTVALLMNYQMGAMEEDTFKQLMAQQTGQDASVFENMTIEQIGEMMHVELKSFQQEKEDDDGNKVKVTCVDVRPIFAAMLESGQMDKDTVLSMRDSMEKRLIRWEAPGKIDGHCVCSFRRQSGGPRSRPDSENVSSDRRPQDGRHGTPDGCGNCSRRTVCLPRRRRNRPRSARKSIQTGCRILQCGDGSVLHRIADYPKHERYPADPDGLRHGTANGCLRTDPWHRRCAESHENGSRYGMDHCSCDHRHSRLRDAACLPCDAEIQADAETGRQHQPRIA